MRPGNIFTKGLMLPLLIFSITGLSAQNYKVKGIVLSKTDTASIIGAVVKLTNVSDSVKTVGVNTDVDGRFEFANTIPGSYKLTVSYISFKSITRQVNVVDKDVELEILKLESNTELLKTVTVESEQLRAEQKGDTTQFNAKAYKTNPDATSEDLVKKMPGVTSDGSTVKVNGEEVKKVLIDGKPFFGDDPMAALKNLPADIVDKVQVFDKSSDQAQFTGFKDGDEQKTINIITKPGRNVGEFGKAYTGYGTDDKYNAGLTFNSFNGSRRLSVIGMSNNINQQNFNTSDIMNLMGSSGNNNQGGGFGRRGMGGPGGGGGADNFLAGQQTGVAKTTAAGFNYADTWGKKISVSGSYFFNQSNALNQSSIARNYFTDSKLIYNQATDATAKNLNHKANFKVEMNLDSFNSITISPRFTYQDNRSITTLNADNRLPQSSELLSKTQNNNNTVNAGYNFQNDLLLQHKFLKKRRSVSLNINTQVNNRDGNGSYYSSSTYNDSLSNGIVLDQQYTSYSKSITWGGNLSYTEPVGKAGQLMFTYRPSVNLNDADRTTKNNNGEGSYILLDTSLSNKYKNTYTSQRGGISYRINANKLNFNIGADLEQATLNGNQVYPTQFKLDRTFNNVLPTIMFSYKFSKTKSININYRTNTKAPSVTQLQNVIDISNPLLVKSGNADLKQTFENNLMMRLGLANSDKARSFFLFAGGNQTNNFISNATYILNADTNIQGQIISKGSQLSKPVNLSNYYSFRSFGVYSFPLKFISSNFNLNGAYVYAHTPALINNAINYSSSNSYNGGIYLSSNISQSFDFSIAYNGSYNAVKNTLQAQSNNTYFNHTATFKLNYILLKRVVFNTDLSQMYYTGLSQSFNQSYTLWNAYIGYKFLKDQSLEAKVSVYDLLNQNRSISRTVTETYTEDTSSNVLKRYLMFTLTYTFKHFKNGSKAPEQPQPIPGMPRPGMFGPQQGN